MRVDPVILTLAAAGAVGFTASVRAQDAPGGTSSVQVSAEGRQVYEQICQSCHMADAKGGGGAGTGIPALAGNPKLASKDYIATVVYHGRGGMPWFNEMLTEQQIAAVTTYVRDHFNAYPEPVTVADVRRIAEAPATDADAGLAPGSPTAPCTCN
jgi:mono/diheme cytochrome c family protein